MNITIEDRDFICKHIPNAVSLMDSMNVDAMLREIYRFIERNGFAPSNYGEYNAIG